MSENELIWKICHYIFMFFKFEVLYKEVTTVLRYQKYVIDVRDVSGTLSFLFHGIDFWEQTWITEDWGGLGIQYERGMSQKIFQ